ncbi:lipopolysaccharide-binding protein-like [Balaenoptera acutorostrata]|uniref:Lipopolysaccharide-binding protein-like n=1 Tax=Balaenoptera acutorostrata TaxID=9767 RepID=A0ABM3S388_BALAC|nr:lipopolysaccharide-binding protein-like [Balaenoptera acutorostrata]
MELEFETSPQSAPFLMFTPGNVTLMPVMDIQAFALLPNSSGRKPLFQLRAPLGHQLGFRVELFSDAATGIHSSVAVWTSSPVLMLP